MNSQIFLIFEAARLGIKKLAEGSCLKLISQLGGLLQLQLLLATYKWAILMDQTDWCFCIKF